MKKDIFSIEIEYGREPAVDSKMCLKYISFNNSFMIPDSTDSDFFKLVKTDWQVNKFVSYFEPTTVIAEFNRKVDPVSGKRMGNYDLMVGKRHAKITDIKVDGINVYITVRNDHFKKNELDSTFITIKNLKDVNDNILNKRRDLEFRQFRELFVQEYNKPLEFQDSCFIHSMPLEQNNIAHSDNSGRFWMNSPLKEAEKEQDSLDSGLRD
jgi:hypothetical protein